MGIELTLVRQWLARAKRRVVRSIRSVLQSDVECNLCGWRGARFESDNWHPYTICPNCYSQVRHRLLAATLARHKDLSYAHLVDGKAVLHFAPEPSLANLIKRRATIYRAADLNPQPDKAIDLSLDITQMTSVDDGQYDLSIACDVLEHVADDRSALRELRRILRPGGYAILTVPQKDGLLTTFEDPQATTPQERELKFGQQDHVRIYGSNFEQLLAEAGFSVNVIDENCFTRSTVRRYVLSPPIRSSHPLATNHRQIFFARADFHIR